MRSLKIKPLNSMEIIVFCGLARDGFVNINVQMAVSEKDEVIGLFESNSPVGIAVILDRNCPTDGVEISCIYIFEEYQKNGYASKFIALLKNYLAQKYEYLYFRLTELHHNFDQLKTVIENNKFEVYDKAYIMNCDIAEKNKSIWEQTKKKYCDRLCNWFARQGFETVSFSQANNMLLTETLEKTIFDLRYNLRSIYNGSKGKFLGDYSFIATYQNRPVAVTMLLEADSNSIVFQLISAAQEFENNGVIIVPVVQSMELAFNSNYKKVSYCIYDYNERMKRVSKNIFENMVNRRTTQLCYKSKLK